MTIDTYAANEAMRAEAQASHGITPPSTEGTVTEQAYNALAHTQKIFERYVERIDTSKFTPEGVQEVIAQFANTAAGRGFEATVNRVVENRDQAAARVEHLRRELSPAGDTATELRNSRYWARTLKILENVSDSSRLSTVAEELIAKADRNELGVLLAELEPYMQTRIETFTGLSPDQRRRMLEGYKQPIEAATDKAIPEYAKAKRRHAQAEKVHQIMQFNAETMRKLTSSTPGSYRPVFSDPRAYDPDR
jgi:hypothetical protein